MHGQFTWYELMTSDPSAAERFYPAVTGWGIQTWDRSEPGNPYRMWTANGVPHAGMMALDAQQKAMGVPPNWLPYVEVSNAADTARRATSLGGRVLFGPEAMPEVGTLAVLSDPQGATFAVLQPAGASMSWDGTPMTGRFSWHELLTTDLDAAWRFYSQLLNWRKADAMDMGPDMGIYQMYGQGGRPFGGMFRRSGRMANVPPAWFCYVHVPDARKAAATAARTGGRIVLEPMVVPGGDVVAMMSDPQGAMFAVHQAAPVTAAKSAATSAVRKATGTAKRAKKAAKKAAKKVAKKARKVGKAAKKTRKAAKSARKIVKKAVKKATRKAKRKMGRGRPKKSARKAPRKTARRGRRAR